MPFTFRVFDTEWGSFGVVLGERGGVASTFLPQPEKLVRKIIKEQFPSAKENGDCASAFCAQIRDYFRGKKVAWKVDIEWGEIPPFRRRVLEACRKIPFGATATYADLARAAGSPGAARAVGSAMATNPLPLLVPCHRVLRSDGSLGGFSSPTGPTQKTRLLQLENPTFRITRQSQSATRTLCSA